MANDVSFYLISLHPTFSVTLRFDLANMLLHFINHWNLETPTSLNQQTTAEDVSAYKVLKFRLVQMWSSNCCRQTTQDGWRIATFPPSVTPSLTMTPPSYLADPFWNQSSRYQRLSQSPPSKITFPRQWGNSCWISSGLRRTKCHLRREHLYLLISQGNDRLNAMVTQFNCVNIGTVWTLHGVLSIIMYIAEC